MTKNSLKPVFCSECPVEKRQWEISIDNEDISGGLVVLRNKRLGVQIELGLRPEGYQGPILIEPRGGGEVTLPYFLHPESGDLWVGLLMESRPNMGGPNLCAIGGMNSASLSRDNVQAKEAEEEAGMKAEARVLPGVLVNSNRLFFLADHKKNEGVRCCAVEVPFVMVEQDEEKTEEYLFVSGAEFGKKPGAVIFKPWKKAILESADVLAHSVIVRLLASFE